ncbi:MgtC/SapB family protein [Enterococcus lemanii]|uniref:MgtC/SapB family protein n=1 Tax=Enterococcus lemanii TaxID=1159752 RepID=A0ABV9MZS1_9ENTE|nr:MgtC/SapB family protein [Enterococcus lemanii]MBM7709672.1 putative Mg2+ transporter-C (MgtC) family protein [Enterococcus lemanii]
MNLDLSLFEITVRLFLSLIMGGMIGMEREYRNQPAGLRTHILVCIGSTVIALIQVQIAASALSYALIYPELSTVIRSDQARLIAQVVSGIGFLGAGTIIVSDRSIRGLTTAASIWAVAGLGLSIGMGYYMIAISSFIGILFALLVVKRLVNIKTLKKIEIRYVHKEATKEFILNYFVENNIRVEDVIFNVDIVDDYLIYTNVYMIDLPKGLTYPQVIEDLSLSKNITKIRMLDL